MAPLAPHVVDALHHGPQAPDAAHRPVADVGRDARRGRSRPRPGTRRVRRVGPRRDAHPNARRVSGDVGLVVRLARLRQPSLQALASARPPVRRVGRRRRRRPARPRALRRAHLVRRRVPRLHARSRVDPIRPAVGARARRARARGPDAADRDLRPRRVVGPPRRPRLPRPPRPRAPPTAPRCGPASGSAVATPRLGPGNPVRARVVPPVANRIGRPRPQSAEELLVHCAQEMAHLAAFLPDLYEEFGHE